MGTLVVSWAIGLVAALVAAVSVVRVATTSGESRFAAGGDLLMSLCMVTMALPATVGWYAGHGIWWSVALGLYGFGAVVMAARHTRELGWRHGRHWLHLIIGSFTMVFTTLAMTTTSSGPVLALSSEQSMPGMPDMESMDGMGSMDGMDMGATTDAAAGSGSLGHSGAVWQWVIAALVAYFVLSIGASLWARIPGTGRHSRSVDSQSLGRWLLAMPDTVLVFLASLTLAVWDRSGMAQGARHGRRRKIGAAPDAALAAHIGMGATMSAMLLMMTV